MFGNFASKLYRGEVSFNFVGRQKLWYTISGIILVISIFAVIFRGLDFSVEFKGGSLFTVPASAAVTQTTLSQVVENNGGTNPTITEIKPFNGRPPSWQVQTTQLSTNQSLKIQSAIAQRFDIQSSNVSITTVGSSWGSQVTQKAIEALIAFLIVIVIYLSIAFEWRMAAAAFVALAHDIVITVGVYALTGFQVSPATIIGLLTILGYSLYDTVVVFDKVRENTAPLLGTRKTNYSQAANLALNQTLVRSINTSLTALLPVAAILIVGSLLLGNGELKDLSLVLFVGMLSGTYSSICIATPVLADLKERQPQYQQLAKQVALRDAGGRAAQRRAKAAQANKDDNGAVTVGTQAGTTGTAAGATGTAGGASGTAGGATGTAGGATGTAGGATGTPARGRPGAGAAAGQRAAAPADPDLADADADGDTDADDLVDDEAVPAGAGQPRGGASARPPGVRQQPVRRPAARRRPSGKKKRR
jgi:preprotein translocase subunit SecF